jgi:hypothetical protein
MCVYTVCCVCGRVAVLITCGGGARDRNISESMEFSILYEYGGLSTGVVSTLHQHEHLPFIRYYWICKMKKVGWRAHVTRMRNMHTKF